MREYPHTYAAQLSRLYATTPELRWEIHRDVLRARKGANIAARAGWIIAQNVYGCPPNFAAQAWHRLTAMEKHIIDIAVLKAVRALKEELCLQN
jgi:hypothetical protein